MEQKMEMREKVREELHEKEEKMRIETQRRKEKMLKEWRKKVREKDRRENLEKQNKLSQRCAMMYTIKSTEYTGGSPTNDGEAESTFRFSS